MLLAIGGTTHADTDLWGHVRFGQDTLRTWSIERVDPYSFTSDRPWINHEWLAELTMGAAFEAGGAGGLAALKLVLFLLSLAIASWSIDRRAGPGGAGAAILTFAGLTSVVPLLSTLRPQGFSVLVFVVVTAILASARTRVLWALPLLFALWANLHGGWVMGLGMLGVWVAAHVLFPGPASPARTTLVGVGAASVLATLATPYGFGLWRFMWETLGFNRGDIVEWRPLTELPELLVPWLLTVVLAALVAIARRPAWAPVFACALLAVASFRVGRMVPFFSLSVSILLLPALAASRIGQASPAWWMRVAAPVMAGLIVWGGASVQGKARQVACFEPLPVLELDPEAGAFLRANAFSGRLLVWFNWGEYAIWHFAPALKVSIDGRRETVYSQRVLAAHQAILAGGPEAKSFFDQLAPDVVWLPSRALVSTMLPGWGWRPAFATSISTVWVPANDSRALVRPIDGDGTVFSRTVTVAAWHGALAALVFAACDSSSTGTRHDIVVRRIVVLGDSLSVSPTAAESFPSLLQKRLSESGSPATIVNAGVRGDTTAGGLRRIDALLAQKPDALILALGANDGLRGLDVRLMSRNLEEMIVRAQKQQVRVLLCGMSFPPVRGIVHAREFQKVFADLARAHDVPLVPFLLEGVALIPEMNGPDQIHPNAAGARRIAETVWPYLEPMVR